MSVHFYFRVLSCVMLILLTGCDPKFEDDTRILVKGRILNQSGEPVSNIEVGVYVEAFRNFSFMGSGEGNYLLGKGLSDSDGFFSVTALFSKDDDFYVHIAGDGLYSDYVYKTDTQQYTPNDLTFDLGNITLFQLAEVHYSITQATTLSVSSGFNFTFKNEYCVESYEDGNIVPSESSCYEDSYFGRAFNANVSQHSGTFITLLGSEIQFTYSIDGITEYTENITVNQQNFTYDYSY